ncbi:hypothetical protein [Nocardiopsis sp. NRRL B-16309]|uniref:hypothetical protein n=1 Tax=Nocardiopsis sp. NRRL B-16309 TaxID=1519494 RepID=UPI0012E313F3|nr:hypothetical protein [Nocardiopsis sp. NRRL B-16309]
MGKTQSRVRAIMDLATAYTWTTAAGTTVRIEPSHNEVDDVMITVGGTIYGWTDSIDTAVTSAARIAPPADTDLAALLTWTACGHQRT